MFALSCDLKDFSTSTFQNRRSHLRVINKGQPKGLFEKEKMINEHQVIYVSQAGANEMQMMSELTVEVQALAKVMYLGLN